MIPRKAILLVAVVVGSWWFLSAAEPQSLQDDAVEQPAECGQDFKDTLGRLLEDAKACVEEWLQQPAATGNHARAYFTYDQGKWSVAAEPYHDPLVSDYGVSAVSNGDTGTVTVEVYREDGELAWSGTATHGDLALLIVDFVDLPGRDRIVVAGEDSSTEAAL